MQDEATVPPSHKQMFGLMHLPSGPHRLTHIAKRNLFSMYILHSCRKYLYFVLFSPILLILRFKFLRTNRDENREDLSVKNLDAREIGINRVTSRRARTIGRSTGSVVTGH